MLRVEPTKIVSGDIPHRPGGAPRDFVGFALMECTEGGKFVGDPAVFLPTLAHPEATTVGKHGLQRGHVVHHHAVANRPGSGAVVAGQPSQGRPAARGGVDGEP